jgi:ubiquinone/menaquinone biosynthesis C-methylase UbiE
MLPTDLSVAYVVGVDLLIDRLHTLREKGDVTPTVNADAALLPFPDGAFDAVVMFTMLSSVPEDSARVAICAEVDRVLAPGGGVLWYDFRVPSPGNSATRPVTRSSLRSYFPNFSGPIASLTVLPPLARRLGRVHRMYSILAKVPVLRTHLAACLTKA